MVRSLSKLTDKGTQDPIVTANPMRASNIYQYSVEIDSAKVKPDHAMQVIIHSHFLGYISANTPKNKLAKPLVKV